MADVTHTSVGYTGTVDQTAEARRFQGVAAPFRCITSTDWQVTVAAGNRTVQIAAGNGWTFGVRDSTSAAATLTSAANTSGSTRLDVVVASYNWATTSTSFSIIQGTTTLPAINTGGVAIAGQINRIPGVQYDAVLAVLEVRNGVGAFLTTDVFEIRPYGGISGYLTIATSKYLTTVDPIVGMEVLTVDSNLRYRYDGAAWTWPRAAQGELGRVDFTNSSSVVLANTDTGLPSFTVTTPLIPAGRRIRVMFLAQIAVDTGTGNAYTFKVYRGAYGTGTLLRATTQQAATAAVGQGVTVIVTVNTTGTLTNQTWTLGGLREAGSGTFSLFARPTVEGLAQFIVEDVGAV